MKIAESSISLNAEQFKYEKYSKEEKLTVWQTGNDRVVTEADNRADGKSINILSVIAKQEAASVKLSQQAIGRSRYINGIVEDVSEEDKILVDLNIRILKEFIERFTGKKIKLTGPGDIYKNYNKNGNDTLVEANNNIESSPGNESAGYGLVYEYHESYQEHERMDFSANGVIKTEDGVQIDFTTSLKMSREFVEEQHISIRAGDALKDPLVINFDGPAAKISNTEFLFDIDSDGVSDQLHFIESGSGFLALDRNQDGEIINGKELFGARTGNGFKELGGYDDDNNGWIDENDQIYDSLRIWHIDQNGERSLASLGQKGIGAIYLGHVSSPFSIKDENNNLQAEVRSTGLFFKENGEVGTVQQLDLVV